MAFTLKTDEFDRLAQLDYTDFDDSQAESINTDNNVRNRIPTAVDSFAPGFRFADDRFSLSVSLQSTLN